MPGGACKITIMRLMRSSLAIALCLLLGITGQAMAYARGTAPATDQAVICFGHILKTVYLDAEGQPTTPPQLCGDCANLLTGLPGVHLPQGQPEPVSETLAPVFAPLSILATAPQDYAARAPPLAVI